MNTLMRWRAFLPALLLFVMIVVSGSARLVSGRHAPAAGLIQFFYTAPDFQGPRTLSRASEVSLAFLDASPGLPRRMFSIRWEGYWFVESSGAIEIHGGGDDLLRIWVDDQLVLERGPSRGMRTVSRTLRLERGAHPLRIEYAQYGGGMHLNVLWAPPGQEPRPLPIESLFPRPPTEALVKRAGLAGRLVAAERAGWILTGAAVMGLWVLPALVVGARGLYRSRLVPRKVEAIERWWALLVRSHGQRGLALASAAVLIWTAGARWGGLNPRSLWADDVWLASLTRIEPIWAAMAVPAPVPPGFVGLLWLAARLVPDPEISLQLVPFLCGLAGPLLLGILVARLTGSRALGLFGISLGLLSPYLANYSVFVKQYSLDFTVTVAFLLLGVSILRDGEDWFKPVVAMGVAGALVSLPSVFSSVPLVHLAALRSPRGVSRRWRFLWALGFDATLGAVFFGWLRGRSSPALRKYWGGDFLPVGSWGDAMKFMNSHGRSAIVDALPGVLSWAAPFAVLGLVWLLLSRGSRWFGAMVFMLYMGLLAASSLQLYPIGQGVSGRIGIFSCAATLALVALGVHAVTRRLPLRSVFNSLVAALATGLAFTAPAPARYFDLEHADLVRRLDAGAQPGDAVVLNGGAAYLAGYYAKWRPMAVPNDSMQGFGIDFDRPHTLVFRGKATDPATPASVAAFLQRERPTRLWFFSTRDDTAPVESVLQTHRCAERARESASVSTQLVEYLCAR